MPTPAPAEAIFMKVSCLTLLLTASPEPRAVLKSNTFTPMLSKTAYPAAFWITAWEVGSSLYKSCKASAAILRVFCLFSSLSSAPPYAMADSIVNARVHAINLSFMSVLQEVFWITSKSHQGLSFDLFVALRPRISDRHQQRFR